MGGKRYNVTSNQPAISGSFVQRIASELSAAQIQEFLEIGLSTVTVSPESRQTFVNNLATENDLARIRPIVETDFSSSHSVLNPMFDPHCILFLRLISHDEIMSSPVLEKAVGTIYNVIYGHDDKRGIEFLMKVANCLSQMSAEVKNRNENSARDEVLQVGEELLLATKGLLNTLTLNQAAVIKMEFRGIVEQLCGCYHIKDIDRDLATREVRSAHENILKTKDILSIGNAISVSETANIRTTVTSQQQRSPELTIDLPGELSQLGPATTMITHSSRISESYRQSPRSSEMSDQTPFLCDVPSIPLTNITKRVFFDSLTPSFAFYERTHPAYSMTLSA